MKGAPVCAGAFFVEDIFGFKPFSVDREIVGEYIKNGRNIGE